MIQITKKLNVAQYWCSCMRNWAKWANMARCPFTAPKIQNLCRCRPTARQSAWKSSTERTNFER